MVFQNNVLSGAGGSGTAVYQIDQSIRFPRTNNTTGGGYMSRTFGSAGDRTSWTWSCWFKLGTLNNFAAGSGLYYQFFACDNGTSDSNRGSFHIIADTSVSSNIQFQFQGHSTVFLRTNRQFRDPSAWMHLVLVWDSDNAVASERARLYINGQRETSFAASSNPTSGQEIGINLNATHRLGISYNISGGSVNYPFDGYMAEIHFLDGYSYGPEFFGETTSNNLWIPKEYTGSYGSNGFKIDGRDASDLGDDESGNGNDFTTSGLASHDQVADTPTNNFCVMNPIDKRYNSLSEGNLKTTGGSNNVGGRATMGFKSGKWYWEMYVNTNSDGYPNGGIVYPNYALGSNDFYGGGTADGAGAAHNRERWYVQSTSYTAYGSAPSSGDIYMYALDRDNNKIFWGVNGTWRNSGDPAGGTGAVASSLTHYDDGTWMPFVAHGSNAGTSECTFNFGQEGTFAGNVTAGGNSDGNGIGNFKYSVPSGYLALCTKNLGS